MFSFPNQRPPLYKVIRIDPPIFGKREQKDILAFRLLQMIQDVPLVASKISRHILLTLLITEFPSITVKAF